MIEILPIKAVHNEDLPVFGSQAVLLSKLAHSGIPVAPGIVITPPVVKLKTTLEHWNFGNKEIFEQKLVILKKEVQRWPVPQNLLKETEGHKNFLLADKCLSSVNQLWLALLQSWLDAIRQKVYLESFNQPVTDSLQSQIVFFVRQLQQPDEEEIQQLTEKLNHKLIIPHKYRWIKDQGIVKLAGIKPFEPDPVILTPSAVEGKGSLMNISYIDDRVKTTVKLFYDLSGEGYVIDHDADGIFLDSGQFDDHEKLLFKLIESASTFKFKPVLFKLADEHDSWGGVRGALRLIHQKSLFNPLADIVVYARNKKGHHNIHLVIPYVCGVYELEQLKRELAAKKLIRKNFLNFWLEADLPENILNLEDYLQSGIDGVIINIDELSSHLLGYDYTSEEVAAYKGQISVVIKFLEDRLKLMHKSKKPFMAMGKFALHPEVMHFLVEKGVYGMVLPKYEIHSARELFHKTEKKVVLSRTT